jgi:hypothetical protein
MLVRRELLHRGAHQRRRPHPCEAPREDAEVKDREIRLGVERAENRHAGDLHPDEQLPGTVQRHVAQQNDVRADAADREDDDHGGEEVGVALVDVLDDERHGDDVGTGVEKRRQEVEPDDVADERPPMARMPSGRGRARPADGHRRQPVNGDPLPRTEPLRNSTRTRPMRSS